VIDGIPVIDVHVHAARRPTLKVAPDQWVPRLASGVPYEEVHDAEGRVLPAEFDTYFAAEGVDVALLMAEYSPKVTGLQTVEDMLPIVERNPRRFGLIAALNPHFHHPLVDELDRQLKLGAVALKIHPVHGGFPPNLHELYPVYWVCQERGVPVVFHCGTSVFPGASNRFGDPTLIDDVARDFPDLTIVLAHGGRGWWYDAAAFLTYAHPNVWIEVSGLPPQKLPEYYAKHDLDRLARKFIFGSDWPAVPGERSNIERVMQIGFNPDVLEGVLWRNAARVYRLEAVEPVRDWLEGRTTG
jgi:predicted TIM-barrel fold metal-dependent hydrolase